MIWILSVGRLFYGKQLSKFFYICFLLENYQQKIFFSKKKKLFDFHKNISLLFYFKRKTFF
jgi:hypothetical protein